MAQNTKPAPVAHAVISPALRDAFEEVARRNNRTLSGELRRAIEEHLAREHQTEKEEEAA